MENGRRDTRCRINFFLDARKLRYSLLDVRNLRCGGREVPVRIIFGKGENKSEEEYICAESSPKELKAFKKYSKLHWWHKVIGGKGGGRYEDWTICHIVGLSGIGMDG